MADLYLWKIERKKPWDYEQYVAAVVVAPTEKDARLIHPEGKGKPPSEWRGEFSDWPVKPAQLKVKRVGIAEPGLKAGTVILADFWYA